jgi:methionine biosynthesis protein MetW
MNQADEPPQRVLDVGCGEGGLGHVLRERHGTRLHLVGVDIAAAALALAEQHYDRVHLVNLDQERLADHVGPQRFDVIVMLETLEHLFKPQAALVQLRDHLAPGGQMIASFPNIAWWRYRLKMLAGQFPEDYHIFDAVEHLQHFTLPTFQRLLTQSGYRVAAIDGEFLQPVGIRHLPRPLRRVLNNRLPNLFGYQIVVRAIPC